MMTPDEDMALKFAVVALRYALLKRAVLSQAEIDVELGDIFAKIAIDKTLGSTLLEGSGLNAWVLWSVDENSIPAPQSLASSTSSIQSGGSRAKPTGAPPHVLMRSIRLNRRR
jgi:hypothetical protein